MLFILHDAHISMKWSLLSTTRRLCFVKPATYIKQEIAILDSESVVLVSSESTFYLTDKWTNLLKPTLHFYTDSHNRRWDIKFHEPLIFPHINESQMCEILMCFPTMKAMMTPDQFIMLVNGRCKYDHPFLYLIMCSVAGFIFGLRNVHSYCLKFYCHINWKLSSHVPNPFTKETNDTKVAFILINWR